MFVIHVFVFVSIFRNKTRWHTQIVDWDYSHQEFSSYFMSVVLVLETKTHGIHGRGTLMLKKLGNHIHIIIYQSHGTVWVLTKLLTV